MSAEYVTLIGTVLGALISGTISLFVASRQHDKSMALIEYRLKELEDKVDKHNNIVERMYKVEGKVEQLQKT